MPNRPPYAYVSPEGETNPGRTPWWQDPLNKAMGMIPESVIRGTQAFERATTPEMPPPSDPERIERFEAMREQYIPQGARDFADFMGMYAGMAGFDPGAASGKAALQFTAPKAPWLKPVAMRKGKEALEKIKERARPDTPSGGAVIEAVEDIQSPRTPVTEYQLAEDLEDASGLYSDPKRMDWERSQYRDQPRGKNLPYERVQVRPTSDPRTSIHEWGHAIWTRQGAAQKAAWKEAIDSGQIPSHPAMKHPTYQKMRRDSKNVRGLIDRGETELAQRYIDGWYDEQFQHWFSDTLAGEISHLGGKKSPFGHKDLSAANYMQEFIQPVTGPKAPSPLRDWIDPTETEALTNVLMNRMGVK